MYQRACAHAEYREQTGAGAARRGNRGHQQYRRSGRQVDREAGEDQQCQGCAYPSSIRATDSRAAAKARTERSTSSPVVAQLQMLTRIAARSRQRVPPAQHSPEVLQCGERGLGFGIRCHRRSSTWLNTTSLRISKPSRLQIRRQAARRAVADRRPTRSTPLRPRYFNAAQSSKTLARRDISGV